MNILRFRYQDAKGDKTERELIQWSETSIYIQGRSIHDTYPKTFKKERIIEFLSGEEHLLGDAAPPPPLPKRTPDQVAREAALIDRKIPILPSGGPNQILFTGFNASFRAELEAKASQFGLKVMKTPGKSLTFLCYGDNAGPSKVEKALDAGSFIIDAEEFLSLISNGELP
ncbi:hypothetical protein PS689_03382 [Pseudomonas fluorescens]|nr:hypothetical protein PS689_03382 [Pseudomonas fluorescens]